MKPINPAPSSNIVLTKISSAGTFRLRRHVVCGRWRDRGARRYGQPRKLARPPATREKGTTERTTVLLLYIIWYKLNEDFLLCWMVSVGELLFVLVCTSKYNSVFLRPTNIWLDVRGVHDDDSLRFMDMRSIRASVRESGLTGRVTFSAFLACLLLHSEGLYSRLLEREHHDNYFADRFVSIRHVLIMQPPAAPMRSVIT